MGLSLTENLGTILKAGALSAVLALAACGDGGGEGGGTSTGDAARDWGGFGQEGDIVLGDPDAPISVIEYASVTCGHCAQFHVFTYPYLKEEYIDTGLVRYTLRELPTAPANMARLGFMTARCVANGNADRYYTFIDFLMRTQPDWAYNPDAQARLSALQRLAAQAGMSRSDFEACRTDQAGLDRVNAAEQASLAIGVQSTPTFYINGVERQGAMNWDTMEELLIPHLPEDMRPAASESAESSDSGS